MSIFRKFRDAASRAKNTVADAASGTYEYASEVTRMAGELAGDLGNRAANIADLRKILSILDCIPFIGEQELNQETMEKSLVILQMGSLTILSTYSGREGANVNVVRMPKVSARKANEETGADHFTSMVISETDDPDEPNIHLLINKENFSNNHRHLTADLIVQGMLQPVSNIPLVGGTIAAVLGAPCRLISRFLINTIYNQAENVAGLFISDKPEDPEQPGDSQNDAPRGPA